MNDEKDSSEETMAGTGASEITGGAEGSDAHRHDDTGVREEGDIAGASSTHAGAGGAFDNTGGTGTAPTSD